MRRSCFTIVLLWTLALGCATPPPSPATHPPLTTSPFPPEGMVTQRGVLTVRGRQFSLNGYVALSQRHGLRLILTEDFGGVLADVLVHPDGLVRVMQFKPPFRPAWVEQYIAADLKCIFGVPTESPCPVQRLSATHFLVERRWYKLDLRTIETRPGPQPASMFEETRRTTP